MTRRFCSVLIVALMGMAASFTLISRAAPAQEIPQPTEHHKILQQDVGVWDAEMKMWIAGPDSEPVVSQGKETNRMLGGMWVISDFEGEFGGMKFSGHGQIGYDPDKKKYVGTWVDSMSPYVSTMEGTYDKKTKTMTMMMKGKDPSGAVVNHKSVGVTKDKNTRNFTMYQEMDGKMVKIMEITYRRKK